MKKGYARLTVNRYINIVKRAFKFGVTYGWVDAQVHYGLLAVESLKAGRTKAPEYEDVEPVDDETVDKTLPCMPPIVADNIDELYREIGRLKVELDWVEKKSEGFD